MDSNKNLDLVLTRKKPFNMSEFRKIANDDAVSSVASLESDKKYHYYYEVKLLNNKVYKVYVKMSLAQIFQIMKQSG